MQVFLSHSEVDQKLADAISQALTDEGLRVWDAGKEVFPGDNYAEKIGKALKESNAMVVVFTPESLGTSSVLKEVEFALGATAYAHRVVPVLARDPDNQLLEQIPWILKRFPLVRITEKENPRKKMQQVAKALKLGK